MNVLVDCRPIRHPLSGVGQYCKNIFSSNVMSETIKYHYLNFDINIDNKFISKFPRRIDNLYSNFSPFYFKKYEILHETYFNKLPFNFKYKIVTIHDIFPITFPQYFTLTNIILSTLNFKRQIAESNLIISVSSYTADELVKKGVNRKKIIVIPNGINVPSEIDFSLDNRLEKLQYYIYVGNIEPRKQVSKLIKSFNDSKLYKTNNLKLCIIGKFGWDSKDLLFYLNNNTDGIIYLGFVPENVKFYYLKNSLGLIFPSLMEGFGIPVIEAMSQNIPVYSTANSALREHVIGRSHIIKDDCSNLKELLLNSNNNNYRIQYNDEAFKYSKKFNWNEIAKETKSLYKI